MKRLQFSLNSALAAVAMAAIDCMALRSIHGRPFPLTADIAIVVVSSLPMANLLTIGAFMLLRPSRNRRPFLLGFEFCGALALFAYAGLALWQPVWIISSFAAPIEEFIEEHIDFEMTQFAWTIAEELIFAVVAFLPQVTVALVGGCLMAWIGRNSPTTAPDIEPAGTPFLRWPQLTLLALVAAPVFIVESALRNRVDPEWRRLEAGIHAVLKTEGGSGFWATLPNQSSMILPEGAAVRIDDDSEPSSIQPTEPAGRGRLGDVRRVRVTLLDGAGGGSQETLPRCFLRPVR
jgi:hypothetical protein